MRTATAVVFAWIGAVEAAPLPSRGGRVVIAREPKKSRAGEKAERAVQDDAGPETTGRGGRGPVPGGGTKMAEFRPPLPPFTAETAARRVRAAEDAWNTCVPEHVSLGYSLDSVWRSRTAFLRGRAAVVRLLGRKWGRELDYRLVAEPWTFSGDRMAVRLVYEWRDDSGNWFRSYSNDNWRFDPDGLITHSYASVNDMPISDAERKLRWDRAGGRPADQPGLSELGF